MKAPAQEAGGGMADVNQFVALFEAAAVPVGSWMSLPMAERLQKAEQLLRDGRTSLGDSATVRRVMDAFALGHESARSALS